MKNKIVTLFLTMTMVLSVCACGNAASKESTGEKETNKSSAVQESSEAKVSSEKEEEKPLYPIVDEPIEVTFMVEGDSSVWGDDRPIIWQEVSELTGIDIEWVDIDTEAIPTFMAGGEWPDVFNMNFAESYIDDYGVLGKKLLNFNDYLEYMPNFAKMLEEDPAVKREMTKSDGGIYALPVVGYPVTAVSARPYVRTDLLEKAGAKIPTTVDEFYDALVAMKEMTGKPGWIPELGDGTSRMECMLFAAFGTEVSQNFDADANGTVYFNKGSEQMKRYYTFLNKLYEEELIDREYMTADWDYKLNRNAEGSIAFPEGEGGSIDMTNVDKDANGDYALSCLAPLTSEYDSTQEILGVSRVHVKNMMSVNADTEYAVEICKMLDIAFATEEVVEGSGLYGISFFSNFGLEGVHFDFVGDDSYVVYPLESGFLKVLNLGRIDAAEGRVVGGDPSNSRSRQLGFTKNVQPYMQDTVFPASALAFTDDEMRVVSNKLTDINKYCDEMRGKFIAGIVDIEAEWDAYCATLETMGIQDVLDAYQAAYDRYMAK